MARQNISLHILVAPLIPFFTSKKRIRTSRRNRGWVSLTADNF
jgi:hypothetical protein